MLDRDPPVFPFVHRKRQNIYKNEFANPQNANRAQSGRQTFCRQLKGAECWICFCTYSKICQPPCAHPFGITITIHPTADHLYYLHWIFNQKLRDFSSLFCYSFFFGFSIFFLAVYSSIFIMFTSPAPSLKKNHSSGGLLAAPGGCFLFCVALFSGVESIMLIYFYFHSDCNLCQADELWKRSKRAWKTCREIQFKWDGTRRGVAKNFPSELEATKSVAYQQAPPKCE